MAALKKTLRARWWSERGAEFVEFALAFPLLLLVVMGIIDFGIMFQQYSVMTNAAREGARVGVLPAYCPTTTACQTNVGARVTEYLTASLMGDPSAIVLEPLVITPVTVGGNCMNTVTVTLHFPRPYLFVGGIMSYFGGSFGSRTLTAQSSMRSEAPLSTCPSP